MIVGIDEVGRGAWAGPLCVGAVCLGDDVSIEGLTDSKKLTAKKREKFDREIRQVAAGVGLGWVSARIIDQIGLSEALKLASRRAITQVACEYDQIIIDGTVDLLQGLPLKDVGVVTMKRADLLIASVSAASIVAKVARDEYMKVLSQKFPGYGFEGHVGYGTAAHMAAINKLGPSLIHRMSFAPMNVGADEKGNMKKEIRSDTSTGVGNIAESEVCMFLEQHKYRIIDRNWKTKWCEIDIIAEKGGVVHFVEVKYRKNDKGGGGLAAITPKKLRHMKFAAELWLSGKDIQQAVLSAVEVGGDEFVVSEFIEVI